MKSDNLNREIETGDLERIQALYDYKFPKKLIAEEPASPRDAANLLVYSRKENKVFYDTFMNLPEYLPEKAVLVFNETKVIPARLITHKETGGRVKLLYLSREGGFLKVMADRKIKVGSRLCLAPRLFFIVEDQKEKYYFLRPSFPVEDIYKILDKYGEAPLPPYIKHSSLSKKEIKEKYQAVFAKVKGSVAAPTASLHFTGRLMKKIRSAGFDVKFITLHVNLGTFAPLTEGNLKEGKLHKEQYEIDKKTAKFLNKAKIEGRPIMAVGTTVARTLESAADEKGVLMNLSGMTEIFIKDDYKFGFINGIITNFHVPRSSLLMLVSAFIGREKLLEIYRKAIRKKFHLFSFGDGMMIR
jgi:S-adenosylmethionine:tRNA ribosyltransferase-isomerase